VAFCHRLGLTSCYNSLYSTFVLCAFLHNGRSAALLCGCVGVGVGVGRGHGRVLKLPVSVMSVAGMCLLGCHAGVPLVGSALNLIVLCSEHDVHACLASRLLLYRL
jgi:hypothetical protein